MSNEQPLLIIVTGPPASGKTTIARELARRLAIPAIHKDDYKESLADQIPGTTLDWSRQLGSAAYEMIYLTAKQLLVARQSCLLEANFHPVFSLPRLTRLAERCDVAQVVCSGDPEILLRRYLDRHAAGGRHPVHLDTNELRIEALRDDFRRDHQLDLPGRVLRCETTASEPVDIDRLVTRLTSGRRGGLSRAAFDVPVQSVDTHIEGCDVGRRVDG